MALERRCRTSPRQDGEAKSGSACQGKPATPMSRALFRGGAFRWVGGHLQLAVEIVSQYRRKEIGGGRRVLGEARCAAAVPGSLAVDNLHPWV
jgi:hypothetical protein